MAARKADVEVTRVSDHQEAAAQLQIGEEVCITCAGEGAQLIVQNKTGQQIGVINVDQKELKDLLTSGAAAVRTIRKQQGTVVQVVVRATEGQRKEVIQAKSELSNFIAKLCATSTANLTGLRCPKEEREHIGSVRSLYLAVLPLFKCHTRPCCHCSNAILCHAS